MFSDFKDHVTLETVVMMLKVQLYRHRNKLHFKMEFLNCSIIDCIALLLYQITEAEVRLYKKT